MMFYQENQQLSCQVSLYHQKYKKNSFTKNRYPKAKKTLKYAKPQTQSECDYFKRCEQQQFSLDIDSLLMSNSRSNLQDDERWFEDTIIAIQSVWQDFGGQIIFKSFGTGVLISPQIVLTTAHNLFSQKSRTISKRIYITLNDYYRQQIITTVYNPQLNILQNNEYYSQAVLEKDLAVIKLNLPVNLKRYMELDETICMNEPIEILGFPYMINQDDRQREDLKGNIKSIDRHVIIHDLPTKNGHSGSPIIFYSKYQGKGLPKICGLHTHKASELYRGIIITENLRQKIEKFIENLLP